jgi:hypothetical protein
MKMRRNIQQLFDESVDMLKLLAARGAEFPYDTMAAEMGRWIKATNSPSAPEKCHVINHVLSCSCDFG